MGIFDRFKKQKVEIIIEDTIESSIEDSIEGACALAIDFGKRLSKELDFTVDSLADLEEILECYSKDISVSKPTENQIWSMSVIFGSYLGEVMLINGLSEAGFFWEKESSSNTPWLVKNDGSHLFPCNKVYKRLVNGAEDNVVYFYRFATEEFVAQE